MDFCKHHEQIDNVLYLSDDPIEAAHSHVDIHIGRQLESVCRILSSVWLDGETVSLEYAPHEDAAPFGYARHLLAELLGNRILPVCSHGIKYPMVSWARLYGGNYDWLWRHGMALADEFTFRFERIHCMVPIIRALEVVPEELLESMATWCDAPAVLPSEISGEETVDRYQMYYKKERPGGLVYTRRQPPQWISNISIFKE